MASSASLIFMLGASGSACASERRSSRATRLVELRSDEEVILPVAPAGVCSSNGRRLQKTFDKLMKRNNELIDRKRSDYKGVDRCLVLVGLACLPTSFR